MCQRLKGNQYSCCSPCSSTFTKSCSAVLMSTFLSGRCCCCPSQVAALVLQKVEEEEGEKKKKLQLRDPSLRNWSHIFWGVLFCETRIFACATSLFWEWPVRLTSHFILASSYFFTCLWENERWTKRGRQINIELSSGKPNRKVLMGFLLPLQHP